jgi:hypothetical protein
MATDAVAFPKKLFLIVPPIDAIVGTVVQKPWKRGPAAGVPEIIPIKNLVRIKFFDDVAGLTKANCVAAAAEAPIIFPAATPEVVA